MEAPRNNFAPEVLSPAGDLESFYFAVDYGADAVYCGAKQFGMRANAKNFDVSELKTAVNYAHEHGVKVYLTLNTLPTNSEVTELDAQILYAHEIGVDAIIVADIGILMLAKRIAPDLHVHISTQAGVVNYLTANELHNLGASRVVLARELNVNDISEIRAKTPAELEIEAFVHGSMCMAFSGRCLISKYLTGRGANEGDCAQPCRWEYAVTEKKRPNTEFDLLEATSSDETHILETGTYIMNAEDLCMIEYLDALYEAGVTSFKIEGRAKGLYYSVSTTHAYRNAKQSLLTSLKQGTNYADELPKWVCDEVQKVSHRPYSTGFYLPDTAPAQSTEQSGYIREYMIVANSVSEGYFELRNKIVAGETLELIVPKSDLPPTTFTVTKIYDTAGHELDIATKTLQKVKVSATDDRVNGVLCGLPQNAILRKTV
ncbi:MAG: U32 family peptidase [Bifidobacteriaceae bacterium]|jgi:putative protease|nr:U32 family peptidase [Bifidobacteriaceae bacterium]